MMKPAHKWLLLASSLYLILAGAGTWVAVRENLAAGFLGVLNGQDPLLDFPFIGTGLSAPLILLVIQVFLMAGLARGVRRETCALGLVILGGMYIVGQLGEPILWQAFVPALRPEIALIGIANVLCPLAMVMLGLKTRQ